MTKEKTIEVKTEESKPTADNAQSEKETPDVVDNIDDILETASKEEIRGEEWDEDTVVLSKVDLAKLQADRDHYKKGLLSAKLKLKASKKPALPTDSGKYLTRDEYKRDIQKLAIKQTCKNAEVNDNWEAIMSHFRHPNTASVESYVEAIEDAFTIWEKKHPKDPNEVDNKEITSDLSADNGKQVGANQTQGKEVRKKRILTKSTPISEWYGKKT